MTSLTRVMRPRVYVYKVCSMSILPWWTMMSLHRHQEFRNGGVPSFRLHEMIHERRYAVRYSVLRASSALSANSYRLAMSLSNITTLIVQGHLCERLRYLATTVTHCAPLYNSLTPIILGVEYAQINTWRDMPNPSIPHSHPHLSALPSVSIHT